MKIKALALYSLIKIYSKLCKIEVKYEETIPNEPVIFAFWHEIILFLPFAHSKKRKLKILISTHRDGLLASHTIKYFGLGTVGGSSHRNPERAFREMLKELKKGVSIGITPDGPKGPRRVVKRGVVELAYLSKKPIYPVVGKYYGCFTLNSWDRFIIPKPLSKMVFIYKKPIYVNSKSEFNEKIKLLEEVLNESGCFQKTAEKA